MADFVLLSLERNLKKLSFYILSKGRGSTHSGAHTHATAAALVRSGDAGLKILVPLHRNSVKKRNIFLLRLVHPTDNSGR
jgi:hypothetical protein